MEKSIKEKELLKAVKKYYKLEKEQKSMENKLLKARVHYIEKNYFMK